jgi:hypothetical protein
VALGWGEGGEEVGYYWVGAECGCVEGGGCGDAFRPAGCYFDGGCHCKGSTSFLEAEQINPGFDGDLFLLRTALWSGVSSTSTSPAEVHVRLSSAAHVTWSDYLFAALSVHQLTTNFCGERWYHSLFTLPHSFEHFTFLSGMSTTNLYHIARPQHLDGKLDGFLDRL